jgi:hypothetical protein
MQPTKLECPACKRKMDVEARPLTVTARKCQQKTDGEKKVQINDEDRKQLQHLIGLGAGHALLQAAVAATPRLFNSSFQFQCPWCRSSLVIMSMVVLANAVVPGAQPRANKSSIPGTDQLDNDHIVKLALNPFGEALREQARLKGKQGGASGIPGNVLRHFHRFLHWAVTKEIKHSILTQMQGEYPHDRFQFWRAEGVVLVTRNDEMFRFLPAAILSSEPKPASEPLVRQPSLEYVTVSLPESNWIRTRFGYLPMNNRLFMGELRRKSKGDFSKPTQ